MTKVYSAPQNTKQKTSSKRSGYNLDKLAQLGNPTLPKVTEVQNKFQKASRRKRLTNAVVSKLAQLDSPLKKSYTNTFYCNDVVLQEGNKATRKYCNNRWCLVCSSVRTAKAINGYKKPLQDLGTTYFFDLTIRSVKAKDLPATITKIYKAFRYIHHNILRLKYGIELKGVRKIECNHNKIKNTFNPHMHFIANGKPCELILLKSLWLNYFPNDTDIDGQDMPQKVDEKILNEMFKYFTKMVVDSDFNPVANDVIFRAMKGKRVYQPLGIKRVSEEVENLIAEDIDFHPEQSEVWVYQNNKFDWVNGRGQTFSGYKPEQDFIKLIRKIET